jgi:hypothetical protein
MTALVFLAALVAGVVLGWCGMRVWHAVRTFHRLLAEHRAYLLKLEWEDYRLTADVDEVDRLVEEWANG